MRLGHLLIGSLIFAYAGASIAHAQEKATDQDRTALIQCLDKAKKTKAEAKSCIGAVQKPCLDAPDGQSTLGMQICTNREAAVWDERLNKAYKAALGAYGKTETTNSNGGKVVGADIIRDAERAWLGFREKKCAAEGLPMAGGTGAALLIDECYLDETAHQAIWLNSLILAQ